MVNMDTNIRTLMGIHISTRMCMFRRRKKKATSIFICTNMNTSTGIFMNMRTKAHPACMNMRKANTAPMSISIPDMKKKSINTKRRIECIFLWNLLTLLRIEGAEDIPAPCFFIHRWYFKK